MQDIHSIIGGGVGGGGIRLYNGGDRRSSLLRPQNQNHEMKCPRCDSLNTKFCYYNNYNLSQPRHFCKSCRRYWTKGGVLRNVPVGGGFRKNKRAKVKQSPESKKERISSSNSSSESSNLTGTTTTPVTTVTTTSTSPEADIRPDLGSVRCLNSDISPFSLPESRFFVPLQYKSSNFDQIPPELETLPEVGSFLNMITSSSSSLHDATALNYKASETMTPIPYRSNQQEQQQIQKITTFSDELRTEFLNNHQTVQFDLPVMQNRSNGVEFTTFDWQVSGDFESTGTVDHDADQVIWNHNQWSDHDSSLYLP